MFKVNYKITSVFIVDSEQVNLNWVEILLVFPIQKNFNEFLRKY